MVHILQDDWLYLGFYALHTRGTVVIDSTEVHELVIFTSRFTALKGGDMKIFYYWLFLNLGLGTVHIIVWRFFAQQVSAENEVSFHC